MIKTNFRVQSFDRENQMYREYAGFRVAKQTFQEV